MMQPLEIVVTPLIISQTYTASAQRWFVDLIFADKAGKSMKNLAVRVSKEAAIETAQIFAQDYNIKWRVDH